ncbi:MAG: 50S ribosomal protein L30 [Trueperaceae bacterium]|nr:50S ribosomal protein L30 [Trueperaceae bacterium]MCC6312218.1 50S ribosomal protein L30 [Trueperaceae bacterium]MCO5174191.1 50S ribosomal protein L30 [Trueperaceae bacterium]MCW5820065.1 50S ribosomal protein L30 [Trueperaceae bacterium]
MKVKLVRSLIGTTKAQRGTANALGLRKIGDVREIVDNESTRGMVKKVEHLLAIEGEKR